MLLILYLSISHIFLYFLGTSAPEPCPPGTFNPLVGQGNETSCQLCTSGTTCSRQGLINPDLPCAPGHYCPGGNYNTTQYPCVAGTYTDWDNLTRAEDCDKCPPSVACPAGTGGIQTPPVPCAKGYFCPEGNRSYFV